MKIIRENLYEFHKTGDPLKGLELGKYSIYPGKIERILYDCLHHIIQDNTKLVWSSSFDWLVLHIPGGANSTSWIIHTCMNNGGYYEKISSILAEHNIFYNVYTSYENTIERMNASQKKELFSKISQKDLMSGGVFSIFLMKQKHES